MSLDLIRFNINYPISIPGDLIQRATVTRMIAPSARISSTTALDMFFPEITDPPAEGARARSDDAQQSPIFAMLSLISALREESRLLRQSGNNDDADLLDRAQQAISEQLLNPQQAPTSSNGAGGIPPTGLDPKTQQMLSDLNVNPEGAQ